MTEDLLSRALQLAADRRCRPEATYRLQMHAGFTFADATAIAGYLRDLGVSHCYSSPYLRARPGSTHGYDIIDHSKFNPEIGGDDDYRAFAAALREHGLGQVLDIVPNHMGVATNDNAWWNDVLENGPASRFAGYFDIAWQASPRPELQDRVLLPVLGAPYGEVLEAGQLRLVFENGAFFITYYERRFPASPRTYDAVLNQGLEDLEKQLGPEDHDFLEYQSILTAIGHLPDRTETDAAKSIERQREKEVIKRRLSDLVGRNDTVRRHVEENVERLQGTPGQPRSFDRLDALLTRQCYRLSYWRVASDEINYRRFFDVNDLAALSMEREDVFDATHQRILGLLADGSLQGVRIDHPDGLYDPRGYFSRLQHRYLLALARHAFETDPQNQGRDWAPVEAELSERVRAHLADNAPGPEGWPLYVVAEKILGASEALPADWAVCGTSGYEALAAINSLFVDRSAEMAFTRAYREWVQDYATFAEVVYRKKRLILQVSLSSELHMLAYQLDRLAQKGRRSRDFTLNSLRDALREVIACFPVYRSYISERGANDTDRRYVQMAVRRAAGRNRLMSRSLFDFIQAMLLQDLPDGAATDEDRAEAVRFAGKFQQVTSPVMAKGVEDTSFYVYLRLVSLNEVGGEPARFGLNPESLHRFNRDRQARWPFALTPLSTHDTKRSEDVRARINVLSEMPEEWWSAVARWSRLNAAHRTDLEDVTAPSPNDEYLIYQTLIGAWPMRRADAESREGREDLIARVQAYMVKAMHEAKVFTSWVNPNAEYDQAVQDFVAKVINPETGSAFLEDFLPFQARVAHCGAFNSLAQTLLQLTSPGAPDLYQGTELWDLSLVDPDNRRPVDYDLRRRLLGELRGAVERSGDDLRGLARSLIEAREDGRVKLYLTTRALHCRRERPGLFSAGEYLPLEVQGPLADHVFAFARRSDRGVAVVAVPRFLLKLTDGARPPLGAEVWQDTALVLPEGVPATRWRHLFTNEVLSSSPPSSSASQGATLRVAELFGHFPVALLLAEG